VRHGENLWIEEHGRQSHPRRIPECIQGAPPPITSYIHIYIHLHYLLHPYISMRANRLLQIWHKKLAGIVTACLKSPEYMHARSALVFLSKVSGHFPTRAMAGKAILAGVDSIEKDGSKEDLKIMARSLGAIIRKRSTTWFDDEPKDKKRPPVPPSKKSGDVEETGRANSGPSTGGKGESAGPVELKGKSSAAAVVAKGNELAGRKGSEGKGQRERSRSNSKSNDIEPSSASAGGAASRSSTDIARDAVKASMRAKRGRDPVAQEGATAGSGSADGDRAKSSGKSEAR
jgi:hypothetical protein